MIHKKLDSLARLMFYMRMNQLGKHIPDDEWERMLTQERNDWREIALLAIEHLSEG